ncbi:MAG: hypothetical protein HXX10_21225 [Rhodoplanes sp.]|uniref:hypothetical protein n=1 Tax=Rhodoplanes sp. TaxID=1968906 RepID=UPI0017F3D267|nr:hypothetical protein [Rhodoplanes sp.]NVO16557.1 hypothetical protein [Rhodoplanes sp.]
MRLPPELLHVSVIRDEDEAMSTLSHALTTSGCQDQDVRVLCALLIAKAAIVAVSRVTGQVVLGFHRIETPRRQRWFTIGSGGVSFVWETDDDDQATLQ